MISFELHYKLRHDIIENSKHILNEIGYMVFNYHIMLFTDFTTTEFKLSIATSVSVLTVILTSYNFYVSFKPKVYNIKQMYLKWRLISRYNKRLTRKRKARVAR